MSAKEKLVHSLNSKDGSYIADLCSVMLLLALIMTIASALANG